MQAIYQVDGGYVISENSVWIPGHYESKEAAQKAFSFKDEHLQILQDFANTRAGVVDGTITLQDLFQAEPK